MTVQFAGWGQKNSGTGDVTYSLPAFDLLGGSLQTGDLLLLTIETDTTDRAQVPAGWQHVPGSPILDNAGLAASGTGTTALSVLYTWYEEGVTVNPTLLDANNHQGGNTSAFRGVDQTNPFITGAFYNEEIFDLTGIYPPVTFSQVGAMVVCTEAHGLPDLLGPSLDEATAFYNSQLLTTAFNFGNAVNNGGGGSLAYKQMDSVSNVGGTYSLLSDSYKASLVFVLNPVGGTGGSSGHITGTATNVAGTSPTLDLTAVGTADWVHVALNPITLPGSVPVNRKATGGSQISNPARTVKNTSTSQLTFSSTDWWTTSWTDGTPTASEAGTTNGIRFNAFSSTNSTEGYTFDVPADTTTRNLKIFGGANNSYSFISLTLSDGSAKPLVIALTPETVSNYVVDISYSAANAGQTLFVRHSRSPYLSPSSGIYLGAITLSESAGGADNLLGDDVQSTSQVSQGTIGQTHTLSSISVQSASSVTQGTLGQTHVVSGNFVESASSVTQGTLGQGNSLSAIGVQSTSSVTQGTLGQKHALSTIGVQSTSEVSSPVLVSIGPSDLLANDVESSSQVTQGTLGQKHSLSASSVQSTSAVSSPILAETSGTFADDVESLSEVSQATLGQTHTLSAIGAQSVSQTSSGVLRQVHEITATSIKSSSQVTQGVLKQKHALLVTSVESASEVSEGTVGQRYSLNAVDVQSASEVSTPTMTVEGVGVYSLFATSIESSSETTQATLYQKKAIDFQTTKVLSSLGGATFYQSGGRYFSY